MLRMIRSVSFLPYPSGSNPGHHSKKAVPSIRCSRAWIFLLAFFSLVYPGTTSMAATNRSAYIEYALAASYAPNRMALDTAHQQIFTVWTFLDRIDVLSTVDYHLIRSIAVPSPDTLDISPDGSTIAVGNSVATILFFSTTSYAKTGEYVLPGMGLGITSLVYTATGDLFVTAANETTSTGITVYWDHLTNSEENYTTGQCQVLRSVRGACWPGGCLIVR